MYDELNKYRRKASENEERYLELMFINPEHPNDLEQPGTNIKDYLKSYKTAADALDVLEEKVKGNILEALKILEKEGAKSTAAIPTLTLLVEGSEGWKMQEEAIRVLGNLKTYAKEAVSTLINQMKDEDTESRENIVEALGNVGDVAVPELIDALKNENFSIQCGALEALRKVNADATIEAIPAIIKLMEKEEDAVLLDKAAWVLGRTGSNAKDAVPVLISAFQEHRLNGAIWALGEIGPAAKDAASAFMDTLSYGSAMLQKERAYKTDALAKIGKDVIPELMERFRRDRCSYCTKEAVIDVFVKIGKETVPTLLKDENKDIKDLVIKNLERSLNKEQKKEEQDTQAISGITEVLDLIQSPDNTLSSSATIQKTEQGRKR